MLDSPNRTLETVSYGSLTRTLSTQSVGGAGAGPCSPLVRDGSSLSVLLAGQSPLTDLPPLALPGIGSRVSIAGVSTASYDDLERLFLDDDDLLDVEAVSYRGGWSGPLLLSAAVALLSALQFGLTNGNMNTAASQMRAALGIPAASPDCPSPGPAEPPPDYASNEVLWGFLVSCFCLSALVGSSFAGPLADRHGRRSVLLPTSALFAVGGLVEAGSFLLTPLGRALGSQVSAAPDNSSACRPSAEGAALATLLVGRLLSGLSCGVATVVVPMYLGEIAPAHLRGALGSAFLLVAVVGMSVAQVLGLPGWLGTPTGWPCMLAMVALPGAAQLACHDWMQESPRWLMMRGRTDEARAALARLRGCSELHDELEFELASMETHPQIPSGAPSVTSLPAAPSLGQHRFGGSRDSLQREAPPRDALAQGARGRARSLFRRELSHSELCSEGYTEPSQELGKSLLRADHGTAGWAPLDVTAPPPARRGWRPRCTTRPGLVCFTLMVAQQFSGINNVFNYSSSFLRSVGLGEDDVGTIALSMNAANVAVVLLSTLLMDWVGRRPLLLASSVGMGCAVAGLTAGLLTQSVSVVCIGVVSFVMCFGIGLGPVVWLLPAELFPMHERAAGMGAVTTANWLANYAVSQSFPIVAKALGPLTFLPFGGVLVFTAAFTYLLVPETRGRTLEQIAVIMSNRN